MIIHANWVRLAAAGSIVVEASIVVAVLVALVASDALVVLIALTALTALIASDVIIVLGVITVTEDKRYFINVVPNGKKCPCINYCRDITFF